MSLGGVLLADIYRVYDLLGFPGYIDLSHFVELIQKVDVAFITIWNPPTKTEPTP